jgi:hypothetical protein
MATPHFDSVGKQGGELDPDAFDEDEHVSLCEALDRILNKGAVVQGDLMISVANVDLLYLGLRVVLTSIETAMRTGVASPPAEARHGS